MKRKETLEQCFLFSPVLNFPWLRWISLSHVYVCGHRENIILSVSGNMKLFTKNGTTSPTQTAANSSNNSPKSYSWWFKPLVCTCQTSLLVSPHSLNPCQSLLLCILLFSFLLSYLSLLLALTNISSCLIEKLSWKKRKKSSLWYLGKIQFLKHDIICQNYFGVKSPVGNSMNNCSELLSRKFTCTI